MEQQIYIGKGNDVTKINNYVKHPMALLVSILKKCGFWIPDKYYLQMLYYLKTGKVLHLKHPQTFGEKIQWLKLYDRQPKYTMMVDKYAVKDYVAGILGKEYIIPTLGVWDRPEDINFDELSYQFVLKTTNGGGSGGVFICRSKEQLDKETTIRNLKKALKKDIYKTYREWPYRNVRRRIIAEQYLNMGNEDLRDYKFYCFNGVPKFCQVIKDRHSKETIDFFDMEWCHQEFYGLNPEARPAKSIPVKPMHFDEMKEMAQKLSVGLAFSRIDLYDTESGPLFGEITLYPYSGMGAFTPREYNGILGMMINLS